ncbi:uncharacterized protein LOC116619026 [Nematostella vectensis]|uniref:uncharacterized protein LOC116619026 n=1 Tax=Nematostella vectensis TaxID=45351 RepID=UPI00207786B0|nr:uncharacterized protein LOC116619026 [Nematostella vectensis]
MAAVSFRAFRCNGGFRVARVQGLSRYYATESSGMVQKLKRFVMGEGAPSDVTLQTEKEARERYYERADSVVEPAIYHMDVESIKLNIDDIVSKSLPKDGCDIKSDLSLKFKVLEECYKVFGLRIPNPNLGKVTNVGDIFNYYSSFKKPSERTFPSIDPQDLPPNLTIGGKLPRK